MKKELLVIAAAVMCASASFADGAETPVDKASADKAYALMESTEDVLAYQGDYSATVSLVVEKPGKPNENMQFKMFERVDSDQFTTVQLFPDADKGQGWIRDGDNIWAYDPVGRKFTHTSLKDALGDSDVKVDDMKKGKSKWRRNYEVTGFADGKLGKYDVSVITLHAVTTEPSYVKTVYYIRKDLPLVLKQENFSGSGRIMRTILLPKYTKVPQGYVATQVILRNELNPGETTQQVVSELTFDKLPDRIFTKAYLEGLN